MFHQFQMVHLYALRTFYGFHVAWYQISHTLSILCFQTSYDYGSDIFKHSQAWLYTPNKLLSVTGNNEMQSLYSKSVGNRKTHRYLYWQISDSIVITYVIYAIRENRLNPLRYTAYFNYSKYNHNSHTRANLMPGF